METYGKKFSLTAFPDQLVVDDLLRTELKAAGVQTFHSSEIEGGDVTLWFTSPISIPDIATINSVVSKHRASLDIAKQLKYAAIDTKTDEIIARGFTHSGVVLSLSLEAQSSMLGLYALREDPAIVYPIQFNGLDDTQSIELVDAADVRIMCLTAVGTVRGAIDSGSALKNAVRAATTISEVNSITDPRE